MDKMIFHISGPSGSGKTYLGNKLKEMFKNKIIVKDIDDLRNEFIKEEYGENLMFVDINFSKNKFQKYINLYIKNIKKTLIFVGLNNMPWWDKNHYYNLHSQYNYYITLDNDVNFKRMCARFFIDMFVNDKDELINDIMEDEIIAFKQINIAIKRECSYKQMIKNNKKWEKDYLDQDYTFMTSENIFKNIVKILKDL